MDLKITNHNNFFNLKGVLNRNNIYLFQKEFRHIFEKCNALTISIERLESIDRYGINAIAQLHNESISKGKHLSVIGMGCDELFDHFKSESAA